MRHHGRTPYKKLVAEIDAIHGRIIRSYPVCRICGNRPVQCCHIFSRSHMNTRWDTAINGNCQPMCGPCHARDHGGAGVFKAWYLRAFGEEAWVDLNRRANMRANYTVPELHAILERLKLEARGLR